MSSNHGADLQELSESPEANPGELELEVGPRAERPNFLTATRFVDFDLPPEILDGLDQAGFEYCTPIQAQAIPVALSGLDIAGQAQTGTGKTTAFLVPLLTRLIQNKPMEPGMPRALIVTPTRELALQIFEDALVLAAATNLRQVLVIGGIDYKEQAEVLATGPEIVICTPGRVIDYLEQGVFKTGGIEVTVIDEADRLLDMGFIKDLKTIFRKLPSYDKRQTMLFSATLDDRVLELTYQYMNPPQYITAEPDKSVKVNIEQELYHIGRDEKLSLLLGLLRREEHRRVIIFSNTKSGVEWLAKKLTMNGFQAEGITGDLPQPKRLKLMEAFKDNRLQILVATDVASRGIHVDDVSHVYNYDLPQDAENYIHRIGRTARAGQTGKAISFGCEDYVFHLEAIENLLGEKIPVFWAEQDIFQTDEGGEVRLKERRGGDRKKNDRRSSRDGAPRSARTPARSQRPGGIFGLSPQAADEGVDVRQLLTWTIEGLAEPIVDGELIEETSESQENSPAAREGRRRKRRRGRRGRDAAVGDNNAAALANRETQPLSASPEKEAPLENQIQDAANVEAVQKEVPQAAKTVEPDRYPKKSISRQSGKSQKRGQAPSAPGTEVREETTSAIVDETTLQQKSEETVGKMTTPSQKAAEKKTKPAKPVASKEAPKAAKKTTTADPAKKTTRPAVKATKSAAAPKKSTASATKTPAKKTAATKAPAKTATKAASTKEKAPAKKTVVKKTVTTISSAAPKKTVKKAAEASPKKSAATKTVAPKKTATPKAETEKKTAKKPAVKATVKKTEVKAKSSPSPKTKAAPKKAPVSRKKAETKDA